MIEGRTKVAGIHEVEDMAICRAAIVMDFIQYQEYMPLFHEVFFHKKRKYVPGSIDGQNSVFSLLPSDAAPYFYIFNLVFRQGFLPLLFQCYLGDDDIYGEIIVHLFVKH